MHTDLVPIHSCGSFVDFAFHVEGGEPLAGREATAPSIIIEIPEVQWQEETPPDGGVVTPKDIQNATIQI
jgi:hypothetical protein